MVYFFRRIKNVNLLFTPKGEERKKSLNIKNDSGEKLVFAFNLDCCIAKKINFIGADFETQFTDKKTVKRKLVAGNHYRKSHSF